MKTLPSSFLAPAFSLFLASSGSAQTTWYVDDDGPLSGPGTSWAGAFRNPGDALAVAQPGDEIRVAAGVYRPDGAQAATFGDRDATFSLGLTKMHGGYKGLAGPGSPDDNDPVAYETVLDGDLLGNDLPGFVNDGENSRHVVTADAGGAGALLQGFTIRHGYADGVGAVGERGGGLLIQSTNVQVIDCRFVSNRSEHWGGGVYAGGSTPVFLRTDFEGNRSEDNGGALALFLTGPGTAVRECSFVGDVAALAGGGMYVNQSPVVVVQSAFTGCSGRTGGAIQHYGPLAMTITGSEFVGCSAWYAGGAFIGADLTMKSCVVRDCYAAEQEGGGVSAGSTSLLVEDTLFENNELFDGSSGWTGGGLSAHGDDVVVRRCTFVGNKAPVGAGLHVWSISTADVEDCVFRGNEAANDGGGLRMGPGSITRCVFDHNSANGRGGGVDLPYGASVTTLRAVTIADNDVLYKGGGLYIGSGAVAVLRDCIAWGNTDEDGDGYTSQMHAFGTAVIDHDYSCIQGWDPLEGGFFNTADDPLFWNAGGGDYHLRAGSPCIDTGDPASPLDPDGSPADMGALPHDPAVAAWLASLDTSISVGAGGEQALSLDAGAAHAGKLYQVLGSLSGSSPGFVFGSFAVPLNVDAYFLITLNSPNQYPLTNSLAVLDGAGRAVATFTLMPGTQPTIVGLPVNHAFGVIDPLALQLELVSNALPVEILP